MSLANARRGRPCGEPFTWLLELSRWMRGEAHGCFLKTTNGNHLLRHAERPAST
jgi:hypothetical protein